MRRGREEKREEKRRSREEKFKRREEVKKRERERERKSDENHVPQKHKKNAVSSGKLPFTSQRFNKYNVFK